MDRRLNSHNIETMIQNYSASISDIGLSLADLKGVPLFQCLKRDQCGTGPYPKATYFEAANRIMTDLVILHGVKYLLNQPFFPFEEYIVEYGNEHHNDHDLMATQDGHSLIGEAFNVAPSFFQVKKQPC